MLRRRYVVRRVGGLEVFTLFILFIGSVVRRVGGLEVMEKALQGEPLVVRRVGGLEGVGGITCESSAIDEETEAR